VVYVEKLCDRKVAIGWPDGGSEEKECKYIQRDGENFYYHGFS